MRVSELFENICTLHETVTFSVAKLITDDPHYPKGIFSSSDFETEDHETCFVCDGTGEEHQRAWTDEGGKEHPAISYTCELCKGSGKRKIWKTPYTEMELSNGNALAMLDALGLSHGDEHDYVGHVDHKDLPALRRKLIRLKNGETSLETETHFDQGKMRKSVDDDGTARIGRGPKMIHFGRTHEQVQRYIDGLLNLIDFAQKNDATLVWS